MLLGDIIARLDDEAVAAETLVQLGDLVLLGRVQEAAARAGVAPGAFAARAVGLFSDTASDEEWVGLIGAMGRTTEPGLACLRRMVEFALSAPGGSHACGHRH
ncbi:hypothetical protein M446_5679 [Methylobacterium sp. 4-46]|uniref:hypothetical protein n=1 Tax=unclassified Methylobacterium TaxID=2615210 RepID=UPI000152E228|nr:MULTISPECIES: hypothetical protein [Methylobacterium]ACA19971.1 hypothetical protein M446_5679 [Methylobacterium sp. 4-46]WFT79156.1 hypothetical protein QA634_28655 [Methylobacterium nodulans]